jgi:2-C-methyl-D-erythritol 4-phosphate cytidylyltransferase
MREFPRTCLFIRVPFHLRPHFKVDPGAYKKAGSSGIYGTDDSVLVENAGVRLKLVMGSYNNIKITTPEDIAMAEGILKFIE